MDRMRAKQTRAHFCVRERDSMIDEYVICVQNMCGRDSLAKFDALNVCGCVHAALPHLKLRIVCGMCADKLGLALRSSNQFFVSTD